MFDEIKAYIQAARAGGRDVPTVLEELVLILAGQPAPANGGLIVPEEPVETPAE